MAFVQELSASFQHIKALQGLESVQWKNLKGCGISAFAWPFLLKGYKHNSENENRDALNQLFRLMEVLCFRVRVIARRADITTRLGGLLKSFKGDVAALKNSIASGNGWYYWGDDELIRVLCAPVYNHYKVYYLFKRYYEAYIKGFHITAENPQIEHIAPMTYPSEFPSGYEQNEEQQTDYSQEFREKYLFNLGNLTLVPQGLNLKLGNKPFKCKLKIFEEKSPFLQHRELEDFVTDKNAPLWDAAAIEKRREKILDFVKKEWCFNF